MAQRDYARGSSRKKTKSKIKLLWVSIALIILISFVSGLYFLKEKSPIPSQAPNSLDKTEKTQAKSQLPSRPEEVWSYIKDLETREIPIDDSQKSLEKNMQLTPEQKKILVMMESERKKAEAAQAKAADDTQHKSDSTVSQVMESKVASKQSEGQTVVVDVVKSESKKVEPAKTESVKKVEHSSTAGKFGLQCGAFKNKAQAENLQARLTMTGLNARLNSSTEWNRVVVGPVGDRASAIKAQEQAKAVTNCVIIGM